jgi:hypothetical protein
MDEKQYMRSTSRRRIHLRNLWSGEGEIEVISYYYYTGLVRSMEWVVYFRKYELYNKMPLTKVFLLIILHFLAYSWFLCVNAFP